MRKIQWKKGTGEYVGFVVICSVIFFLFIMLAALIQFSIAVHSLNQSLNAIGEAAAMCNSMQNAKQMAKDVANDSIYNGSIENVKVKVEYAEGNCEWENGTYIKVTVSGKINTIEPYWTSRRYGKACIVPIQGGETEQCLGLFRTTSYWPGDSGGQVGRTTCTGATATANHTIAVDPNVIPLGSRVRINGIVYVAEDIGGAIIGNHIDIFVNNASESPQIPDYSMVYLLKD